MEELNQNQVVNQQLLNHGQQEVHRPVRDISHDQKFVIDQNEEHIAVMHKEIVLVTEFVASSHV